MIDIHCHILPNIDDGPSSMDESIAMARLAVDDGIHTIVATPHSLNGVYTTTVTQIVEKVAELHVALARHEIKLQVCPGSDVHICPGLVDRIAEEQACTINDANKYIILEFPTQMIPPGVKDELFQLKLQGITPVISHPERIALIQRDGSLMKEFIAMGALGQVTAMSVTGDFGMQVQETAEELIRERLVHIIATDAHSADGRPPILSAAVERAAEILGSYDEASQMVTDIPAAILAGEEIDVQGLRD